MKTDVLIIGGGLSGLHTAYALHTRGIDTILVEARGRLGGRILSRRDGDSDTPKERTPGQAIPAFDLGPTWFWPGQRRIEALVQTLGLGPGVFYQQSEGETLYENEAGGILRGISDASMAGSFRLEGGLLEIINALVRQIPEDTIRCRSRATRIARQDDRLHTTIHREGHDEVIDSARVVIALPPRIAAESIELSPALPAEQVAALRSTPTWMAGSAKLVALYDEPFWRADGFSGDALSHRGPLGEIHDASPLTGGPAALFGFVGVPPRARGGKEAALKAAAMAQLERLFGQRAAQPREVWLKDWAFDPLTATEDDRELQIAHPFPWSGETAESTWDDRLLWAGSETASEGIRNNGYLEGALEASARTVNQIESD